MSYTPQDAAIRLSAEDERKIANMTEGELIQYMHTLAEQQGLATRDPFSNELIHTELSQNAPRTLSRALTINGTTYTIEGADEKELLDAELSLHRQLQQEQEQVARDERGRFVSQQQAATESARNAELELAFKRGQISTDEYLSQSGAIERHLAELGIDVASLREVSGRGFQQRWSDAAESFRASHPEWQGGEAAKNALGQKLIAMGLVDEPSVESLNAAYEALQREGGLPDNPEIAVSQKIGEAKSFQDIQAALGRTSSSVFGGYR